MVKERRRNRRLPVDIQLKIESLYKQDHVILEDINQGIVVTDISKSGVGFNSSADLPLGFYFNARIEIDQEKKFYSVLKIIRKVDDDDGGYHFGCEFVGLADILSGQVDDYEHEHEHDEVE